jgi:hypothetical protein
MAPNIYPSIIRAIAKTGQNRASSWSGHYSLMAAIRPIRDGFATQSLPSTLSS